MNKYQMDLSSHHSCGCFSFWLFQLWHWFSQCRGLLSYIFTGPSVSFHITPHFHWSVCCSYLQCSDVVTSHFGWKGRLVSIPMVDRDRIFLLLFFLSLCCCSGSRKCTHISIKGLLANYCLDVDWLPTSSSIVSCPSEHLHRCYLDSLQKYFQEYH